jgi:anti-sigma regulatory factor (Ser/Thr protein kinase)
VNEQFQLMLSPSRVAPAAARGALGPLRGALDEETLEATSLLVSELVTNSVRHAGIGNEDWIELLVEASDGRVRVSVTDPGGGFARPPRPARADASAGWGLFLVSRLADRWGVERGRETVVWFEIDRRNGALADANASSR